MKDKGRARERDSSVVRDNYRVLERRPGIGKVGRAFGLRDHSRSAPDLIPSLIDSILDYGSNRKENGFRMTAELQRAVKRYGQWFGSYKRSGELIKVQVWLTVNDGCIEFLSSDESYKVKRIRRDPRVICYIGDKDGPSLPGTAEIVMGRDAVWRVYRSYWKTHPVVMTFIGLPIRHRIKTRKQVLIRVRPDEPNPLAGVTDPAV